MQQKKRNSAEEGLRKEQMSYRQHRLHRIVIKKGRRKGSLSRELQKHTNRSEVYKQKIPGALTTPGILNKTATTYSPTVCSTIGVTKLNFSVRNGKRWNLRAIVT